MLRFCSCGNKCSIFFKNEVNIIFKIFILPLSTQRTNIKTNFLLMLIWLLPLSLYSHLYFLLQNSRKESLITLILIKSFLQKLESTNPFEKLDTRFRGYDVKGINQSSPKATPVYLYKQCDLRKAITAYKLSHMRNWYQLDRCANRN